MGGSAEDKAGRMLIAPEDWKLPPEVATDEVAGEAKMLLIALAI